MFKLVSIYSEADSSVVLESFCRGDCVSDVLASSHPMLMLQGKAGQALLLEYENMEEGDNLYSCFYVVEDGVHRLVGVVLPVDGRISLRAIVVNFHNWSK